MLFLLRRLRLPAQTHIQGQLGVYLEVVLNIGCIIVVGERATQLVGIALPNVYAQKELADAVVLSLLAPVRGLTNRLCDR